MPSVNPNILQWARETAGLTPEQAVERLQLRPTRGVSALERLEALESGVAHPSRALLVRMAKQYRRPLVTFYMSQRPRLGDRGQDFRTLPEGHSAAGDALLDALIRDVRARQSLVRAALEDEEEAMPLAFVGSRRMSDGVQAVLSSLRDTLRVSLDEFRAQTSPEAAFALLRGAAESAGVFVLLMGNLGSHHTTIDLQIFRGMVLADNIAPFVIINDQDSRAAWSFTLLHELTHLLLGQTGVSGEGEELEIERFCNAVASEFLLPTGELTRLWLVDSAGIESMRERISSFARERNLSASMVAYGLYRARSIDQSTWRNLNVAFHDLWLRQRTQRRERTRDQEGGPNYYVVRGHRVGRALLTLVHRMMTAGALTTSKASKILGVKAKQVQALFEATRPGGSRQLV